MIKAEKYIAALVFMGVLLLSSVTAQAVEEYTLTIRDHHFIPETLNIPADQKVKIIIVNEDSTPEEFESYALNREKIIRGGGKGIVFIGPLKPGTYPFFGEFNMDTATGQVVVGQAEAVKTVAEAEE